MAITFVSVASNQSDQQTSTVVTKPASIADGDVLVALATISFDASSFGTFANPGTFTAQFADSAQGQSGSNAPLWRVSTRVVATASGEGASYTWTHESGRNVAIVIGCFRGVDNTTPVSLAGASAATAQSTTQVVPTRTTAVDGVMWLGLWAMQNYDAGLGNSFGTPAGMTITGQRTGPFNFCMIAHELRATAGATGTRTSTLSAANSDGRTGSIGLLPAVAATPPYYPRRGPKYRR